MLVVHVDIHVIQGAIEAFKDACVQNATASLEEPGVVRFDFVQRVDAPERFLLIEVYRDADAAAACARFLPYVMEANVRALTVRDATSDVLARYDRVAQVLTGNPGATAHQGIEWAAALSQQLAVPRLSVYGMTRDAIPGLVEKAARSSSMKGNPILLTETELTDIALQAL